MPEVHVHTKYTCSFGCNKLQDDVTSREEAEVGEYIDSRITYSRRLTSRAEILKFSLLHFLWLFFFAFVIKKKMLLSI